MLSSVALALAFTVAVPAIKIEPPSIVGEWESVPSGHGTMKFAADNTLIIIPVGQDKIHMTYRVDFTTTPMEIDLMMSYADPHIPPGKPTKCILKFEDDKIFICFPGKNEARPTKFESTAGDTLTLKRKKEKSAP